MKRNLFLVCAVLINFSCVTTNVEENTQYVVNYNHDQTGFLYSILTGIQMNFGTPFPQSMIKKIYEDSIKAGYIEYKDNMNIIINPDKIAEMAMGMIKKKELVCEVTFVSSKSMLSDENNFTIRIGKKSNGEVHYNYGDNTGKFLWDSETGNNDLMANISGYIEFKISNE